MENKKNKSKKSKNDTTNKIVISKKLVIFLTFITLLMLGLITRIGYIQFINGPEYKQEASNRQTISRIISPKRGTIFDSTGKALAISANVDTVTVNPIRIKEENKEKVATALSEIFKIDYNEVLNKIKNNSTVETIIKKVEKPQITELENWIKDTKLGSGINIDADSKRYYPYSNLASNLIGFCGTDNQGLEGIESKWDNLLTGTGGKIVTSVDSSLQREEIPDENKTYIPVENGSNIMLTIDYNIQTIAEKYLKKAVEDNKCTKGGNVVIMDPSTGDVLAMATYPDYNLNTPFTPNTNELTLKWDNLTNEEKNNSLYKIWKNTIISDGYEPGSTFKVLNSAIGIEENIVTPDKEGDFLCTGSQEIADTTINCWRKSNPHGYQTLRKALENSCNPAFIQLGQRIGARTLYKYYKAFGLFDKTEIAAYGEGNSYFSNLDTIGPVELATMSFGQRFTITPIQLITAISSIANNGVLMQPRIVKQIINTDTGNITNIEPKQVREVLSKETCDTMKSLMESVVVTGTGNKAQVKGYSVGGKTGTTEPISGKESEGYIASYVAISPIINTKVAILLTLHDPKGTSHQGGQVVGPVISEILTEVLPYLGIASDDDNYVQNDKSKYTELPDITNKTITEAQKILSNSGFRTQINTSGNKDEILVTSQVPTAKTMLLTDSLICLYTKENDVRVSVNVPNLTGLTAAQAKNSLTSKKLNISIEGTGRVVSQNISADTTVEEGTVVKVTLKDDLN